MRALADLAAPHRCVTCRRAVQQPPWCDRCRPTGPPLRPACQRCGDLRRHDSCPLEGSIITRVVALGDYGGPLGDAVRAAKAAGAWAGWDRLADGLARHVAGLLHASPPDVVTWIPADRRRRRRRGRDHAADLAMPVARRLGVEAAPLLTASMRRTDQAGLSSARRRTLPPDAYLPDRAAPARVLLVDDVVATGSTVLVAARALRTAGAQAVVVAALCRAGGSAPASGDVSA